jgi:hypothetical protein
MQKIVTEMMAVPKAQSERLKQIIEWPARVTGERELVTSGTLAFYPGEAPPVAERDRASRSKD